MHPDPSASLSVEIIISVSLLLLCGLLTAAQKAISDVNRNHIKQLAEEGSQPAARVIKLFEKSSKILAVTLTLLTFFGFLIIELVASAHTEELHNYFLSKELPFAQILAILLITVVSSTVFLVFALFIPRQIAKQHTEGVAFALATYANVVITICSPFAAIVSVITNIFLRIFRQNPGSYEEAFSEENVISMLEQGQEEGVIKEEGKKMINSIFAFDDKLAYEIMTPRTDVFTIDIQDEREEYLDELMEMRYSRIPVYDDDSDNIIGILNIKDYLIKAREDGFENVDITGILREPFFVPETKNIDSLFFELQKTKQHIAILIDEYGGFSGIVTMEDIIEEVMGDIDDEFDEAEHEIEDLGDNKYLIDGYMDLDDINEELNTNLESETSETVGGLIIDILGEIPDDDPDEKIFVRYENYDFEVVSVRDRRIEQIIMTIRSKEEIEEEIQENTGE